MWKIIFQRALYGLIAGLAAAMVYSYFAIQSMEGQVLTYDWLVKCMRGYAILGLIYGPASLCFHNQNWSLLKQTMVHFVIALPTYIIVNTTNDWMDVTVKNITFMLLSFIFIYGGIWAAMRHYWMVKIRKLNEDLPR